MLGDGHLETQNGGRTYRLKVEYASAKDFYANWLFGNFQAWVRTPPQVKVKKLKGKETKNIWFQTLSHPAFRFYARQFYSGGRKGVPGPIIKRWFTPRALGVWFMDDGSCKSSAHKALILNTQGFTQSEILLLMTALEERYAVKSQIRRQRDGLQILIVEPSASRFASIIRPYFLPEFVYMMGKVGLTQLPKE